MNRTALAILLLISVNNLDAAICGFFGIEESAAATACNDFYQNIVEAKANGTQNLNFEACVPCPSESCQAQQPNTPHEGAFCVYNTFFAPFSREFSYHNACPPPQTPNVITGACEDADQQKSLGNAQQCMLKGNPVNPATGNKLSSQIDISSTTSLSFTRYYNSMGVTSYDMGRGWSATYFQRLIGPDPSIAGIVKLYEEDGRGIEFNCPANQGVCAIDPDITLGLEKTAIGYTLITEQDVVEQYALSGKLLSITPRSGETQTLSYNASTDLLETVTDSYGKTLSFTYETNSDRLLTVTDPDGELYSYSYDTTNNLSSVTFPDDTPGNTNDNPSKQYQYTDTNFPNHLTDVIDENGNTFASFGYDTQGRAIFTEHDNGTERIDLIYNANGTTTVTDSLGAANTYTYDIMFGVPRTSAVSGQQCGSGCSGEGQNQTYDSNGFLASRTDFEGNLTTFINNTRGLQESRTEAVGATEARTITTEWHPTFRLPTKITEPGKETIFTYDSQGRQLSRTEREI